jgi:hypothetical protein
MICA